MTSSKLAEYPETVLEFADPAPLTVDLRVPLATSTRRALAAIGLGAPFAVLTAENPHGENAEDAPTAGEEAAREVSNERRMSRLERELAARGVTHRHVDGVAPDGSYRERCVAAVLPRDEAVELARRFGQLALFWFDGDRFWLMPAEAGGEPRALP